jgi:hypothetical protein
MCRSISGLPVRNATEPLTITVKQGDIDKATPLDPDNCAIACAIRRQEKLKAQIRRGMTYVHAPSWNYWLRYRTPGSLRIETMIFDRNGDFAPGDYTLGAVPPSRRTGRRQGSNSKNVTGKMRQPPREIPGVRAHA